MSGRFMTIFGLTCLVFKTTYIDRRIRLREGAFFFTRRTLFPPLYKKNTRDNVKGLRTTSERHIGGAGRRYLSTLNNRGQGSRQQAHERAVGIAGAGTPSPKVFEATSTKRRS